MTANQNTFAILKYRKVRGHDGQGFEATLGMNGKKVAYIFDDGWGGEFQYDWTDKAAEAIWTAAVVARLKPGETYVIGESDVMLDELIDAFEDARWIARELKKGMVVFQNPNPNWFASTERKFCMERKNELRTVKPGVPFNRERVLDFIMKKYPAAFDIRFPEGGR